jgi:hypothetical protein
MSYTEFLATYSLPDNDFNLRTHQEICKAETELAEFNGDPKWKKSVEALLAMHTKRLVFIAQDLARREA